MPQPRCSDEEFIALIESVGVAETARRLNMPPNNVYARRKRIEERLGRPIFNGTTGNHDFSERPFTGSYERIVTGSVADGVVIVGGDAHCWPHRYETAKRAFVHACKKLDPKVIVLNGDIFDGASISRFPRIGWEWRPTIRQEMDAVLHFTGEIEKAAPNAERIFTIGNHDIRFETFIARNAPDLEEMPFTSLGDFLPKWRFCWRYDLNFHSHPWVIKHRYHGGIHASFNNTLRAGVSTATNHTHRLLARPWDDARGTRWGVECGCLIDPHHGDQMAYSEANPHDMRAGFMVLAFEDSEPFEPSPVRVIDESNDPGDGRVEFQGNRYRV